MIQIAILSNYSQFIMIEEDIETIFTYFLFDFVDINILYQYVCF